jgi:dUTP pyrophosphatase
MNNKKNITNCCHINKCVAGRSSLAKNFAITVMGGVIDEDFIGEVGVILHNTSIYAYVINKSDKIAQLILGKISTPPAVWVESLEETSRGEGGFGSTGK